MFSELARGIGVVEIGKQRTYICRLSLACTKEYFQVPVATAAGELGRYARRAHAYLGH